MAFTCREERKGAGDWGERLAEWPTNPDTSGEEGDAQKKIVYRPDQNSFHFERGFLLPEKENSR